MCADKTAFELAMDAVDYTGQLKGIFAVVGDGKLTDKTYSIHKNGMPKNLQDTSCWIPTIGIPVETKIIFDRIKAADKSNIDIPRLKEMMQRAIDNLQNVADMKRDDPAWGKSARGMTQEFIDMTVPELNRTLQLM